MTLIAITNPSDTAAEASTVEEVSRFEATPRGILKRFGNLLEDGAQVVMVEDNRVWQYVVTRDPYSPESVALRSNNALAGIMGEWAANREGGPESLIEVADVPLASEETPEPEELETYTVFGENDDSENFIAVVSAASPEAAWDAGVQAGLADEGYEDDVDIYVILKGDHSESAINTSDVDRMNAERD